MTEKFNPEQFTVPVGFPEILKDLNREILRAQPKDIYQFCAEYFGKKLSDQKKGGNAAAAAALPKGKYS